MLCVVFPKKKFAADAAKMSAPHGSCGGPPSSVSEPNIRFGSKPNRRPKSASVWPNRYPCLQKTLEKDLNRPVVKFCSRYPQYSPSGSVLRGIPFEPIHHAFLLTNTSSAPKTCRVVRTGCRLSDDVIFRCRGGRAIPCWGKVSVARGKCGLGKVANRDWHEISACAIKNETFLLLSHNLPLPRVHKCVMGRPVHTGLSSSSLVAHVVHYPPPPTRTAL